MKEETAVGNKNNSTTFTLQSQQSSLEKKKILGLSLTVANTISQNMKNDKTLSFLELERARNFLVSGNIG